MASANIPFRTKGQTTCPYHKGRPLEFYCNHCDELICPKCLSSLHSGHQVCELSEITPRKTQKILNFIDRTEQIELVQIRNKLANTDILLKDNDSEFEKLSHQLKKQSAKLKQDIDTLTAETLSLYQKMKEDNARLIEKYKQDLEMYDRLLNQQVHECKAALQHGSKIYVYDTECEIDSRTNPPIKPSLGTVSFTPNTSPRGHLEYAFGKVVTLGQGHTSTIQGRSVSSIDVRGGESSPQQTLGNEGDNAMIGKHETKVLEKWKSPCDITSVCPTTDDQAWTSYNYSRTLTLLDKKGTVLQTITHTALIKDISLSPITSRLWVCDDERNILELVSGRLVKKFKTKIEPICICVTAHNYIIVGMAKHITKFTTQGQIVMHAKSSKTGKPLVYMPHKITECPVTHNVAVIDYCEKKDGGTGNGRKHIVVMDMDLQKLFVYRGDDPKTLSEIANCGLYPDSVVYDSSGNIIIGAYSFALLLSGDAMKVRSILPAFPDALQALGVSRTRVLWSVFNLTRVNLLQYGDV